MNYLAALGIAPNRMSTVGYGKERPVCTEHGEACWALNRRAHIVVKPRGGAGRLSPRDTIGAAAARAAPP